MSKIKKDQKELEGDLNEQIELLEKSCDSFDSGVESEAKRIAHSIRLLLHDTKLSKSLLGQLNKKTAFWDSAFKEEKNSIRIGSYGGLLSISGDEYIPNLDDAVHWEFVDFNDYWNRVIFIDKNKKEFTRKDIVLFVANQDGGSHVDSDIDEDYFKLSRDNSMGWMVQKGESGGFKPVQGPELSAIRQIGHEVLKTLVPGYSKRIQIKEKNGIALAMGEIYIKPFKNKKINRNDPCPCGSGKKYKNVVENSFKMRSPTIVL